MYCFFQTRRHYCHIILARVDALAYIEATTYSCFMAVVEAIKSLPAMVHYFPLRLVYLCLAPFHACALLHAYLLPLVVVAVGILASFKHCDLRVAIELRQVQVKRVHAFEAVRVPS